MKFYIDGRLAQLLGASYSTIAHALKELIDNAWDADAENVYITIPLTIDDDPVIIIRDDGIGMDEACISNEYMHIARNRRLEKGMITKVKKRFVKGNKGIGKFSGLLLANKMLVTTAQANMQLSFQLDKNEFLEDQNSLSSQEIMITKTKGDNYKTGTMIELHDLVSVPFISLDTKLKQLLIFEYGREDDFNIYVNETILKVEDIGGRNYNFFDSDKRITLNFNIADKKLSNNLSGIILKVGGKIIGHPNYWGVEDEEFIHVNYLKKVYGEVSADFLEQNTTSFWGIIEETDDFQVLRKFVKEKLKLAIEEKFEDEIKIAKKRLENEIKDVVDKLPEHKKDKALRMIDKLLTSLSNGRHSSEQIKKIVTVIISALDNNDYYEIVEELSTISDNDIILIADALKEFGLIDMIQLVNQAKARLNFLDNLQVLVNNDETTEREVHLALASNLWIFGASYSLMTSDQSMKTIIETFYSEKYENKGKNQRPDLLLSKDYYNRLLLIEFKRPSIIINRTHEAQIKNYKDILKQKFIHKQIEMILIGKSIEQGIDSVTNDLKILSYDGLISDARSQITWLLENLSR